jgi:hypothetical protein
MTLEELKHTQDQAQTNSLPIMVDPGFELELLKERAEQDAIFQQLGLVIPENVSPELRQGWDDFTKVLYYGVNTEVVNASDIPTYLQEYSEVLDENKALFKTQVYNLIEQKVIERSNTEEAFEIRALDNEIEEIASLLPEEERERFVYFMNTGEGLTDEDWAQIQGSLTQQKEQEVLGRLERALNRDTTLNIGIREQKTTGLTPEELTAKFGLDEGIKQANSQNTPQVPAVATNTAQSLYQAVQQKREEVHAVAEKKSISRPTFGGKKQAGLDELLK